MDRQYYDDNEFAMWEDPQKYWGTGPYYGGADSAPQGANTPSTEVQTAGYQDGSGIQGLIPGDELAHPTHGNSVMGTNPAGPSLINPPATKTENPYAIPTFKPYDNPIGSWFGSHMGLDPSAQHATEYLNKIKPARDRLLKDYASGKISRKEFGTHAVNFPSLKEKGLAILSEKPAATMTIDRWMNMTQAQKEAYSDMKRAGKGDSALSLKDRISSASTLRKDFRTDTAAFNKISDSWDVVTSAQDTGIGDVALVFNIMKIFDPGSTVREGEAATARNSSGVPDMIKNLYNQTVKGRILPGSARVNIIKQAEAIYSQQHKNYTREFARYDKMAKGYGLNPFNVTGDKRKFTGFDTKSKKYSDPKKQAAWEAYQAKHGNK